MPHDVFISYSSIDKKAADAACAIFEQRGIRCWIAPRDVPAGSEWAEAIIDAIEAAKVMVLIFSSNSNESRQVRREVELAVGRGVTIMPLRLEKFEPTRSMAYFMAGVHWIDALTPPLDAHLKTLAEWIKPHLKGGPAPEPEPPRQRAQSQSPPPPPPRRADTTEKPPRVDAKQAADKLRRKSSSIFGDFLYEFFGVGAKAGGMKIADAGKAINEAKVHFDAGRYGEAITGFRAVIERIKESDSASLDWNLSIAMLNLAIAYRAAGRTEDALKTYRAVVQSCGDISDQLIEKQVAMAMNNHAGLLMELGRPQEAIPIQDDVVARYSDTINTDLARQLTIARLNRGVALGALGRDEEAITAYNEVIALTHLRVWPQFDEYIAIAMVNKGVKLAGLGRREQALGVYTEMISIFGKATDATRREQVAKALTNSANTLVDLRRYDEAIAACDKVIAGPRDTPSLLQTVALATRNKVAAQRDAGRKTEAAAAADKMLAEFGNSTDRTIAEHCQVVRRLRAEL
jgi:tetratricopeptide (TPR) repeat protein